MDPAEPPKDMRASEVTAVLVVIAVGLCLLPIFFADACNEQLGLLQRLAGAQCSSWYVIVRDYQTLISGFFAIVAAYVAVFHMRDTENAQRLRHFQQIIAQYTPAMLTHNRAIYLLKPRLEALTNALDALAANQDDQSQMPWSEQARTQFQTAMWEARQLRDQISGAVISEIAGELGPRNEDLIGQCRLYSGGMVLNAPDDIGGFFEYTRAFDPVTGAPTAYDDTVSLAITFLREPARELLHNFTVTEQVFAAMQQAGQKLAIGAWDGA